MKTLMLVSILTLPLCGCMSMANVAAQLKNDPATVDIAIQTIYGSVIFHRAFPTNWTQPVVLTMPTAVSTNTVK